PSGWRQAGYSARWYAPAATRYPRDNPSHPASAARRRSGTAGGPGCRALRKGSAARSPFACRKYIDTTPPSRQPEVSTNSGEPWRSRMAMLPLKMSVSRPKRSLEENPRIQFCSRFYLRLLRPGHGSSISPSTHRRQRVRADGVDAGGMTKPSSANAGSTGRVRRDVKHDIVWTRRVAAHTGRDVIQFEIIADAPTDVVVGARGVAAHPDGPDYAAGTLVQRESSTED